MTMMTLLTAHPDPASFNAALADAWRRGAEAEGATVKTFDVPRLAFDPVLRGGYRAPMDDEPALAELRAALEASAHVTWVFPTWWAAPPAILKALVDRLFLPGWAFRFEGRALPTGLLAGRSTRYVATMDSPALWYHLAHRDALAGSFGRATLAFVGFAPIQRTLIHEVRRLDAKAREKWLTRLEAEGRRDVRTARAKAPTRALPAPVSARPGPAG
ncbi:NAD(P)H-dependent oxidoreductase [Myxococcota bacterium]|nr:NAD(P)H-dependent oxidoreductase [Myxococcota bacterium]